MTRLRELRQERARLAPHAFTAAAMAARIGVTESALLRWERGTAKPRKRHQRALANELGVRVEDLELGMTLERERQVWQEREASLTELADRVSISNLEETDDVSGGDESPDRRHHVELPARRDG